MAATRTVRDMLTRAMRAAQILGAGETMDADDANDALISFNQMLDAWQAERLFAYAIVDRSHPLTSGVGTYTVGPSGTINIPRPIRIEWAFTRDAQNYDRTIQMVPDDVYAAIALKSLGNNFPTVMFYEATYPIGQIKLWQLPTNNLTLFFGAWQVLSEYASLNDIVSVPPGYEDAFVYSMVERLCPEYGKPTPASIEKLAQKARANIQSNNLDDPRVSCEFDGIDSQKYMPYQYFVAGGY